MNTSQTDRLQWLVTEDLVREILSAIRDLEGFIAVARIIEAPEPTPDGKGSFGRWAGIPADCEARREGLLHELVAHAEATTGIPWPFSRDRRPEVPDTVEGLQ